MIYHIENTIVEELKEQGLNVIDLLQTQAKKQLKPIKVTYEIDDKVIEELVMVGIDVEKELIDALENYFKKYPEEIGNVEE